MIAKLHWDSKDLEIMGTSKKIQVAVVGSGPSGFYTAEALINTGMDVEITIIEKLPCPYGLVRYGVAPDHQKLKSVTSTRNFIFIAHPNASHTTQKLHDVLVSNFKSCIRVLYGSDQRLQ